MAESTLKITFTEIRTEIGRYLGLDRTYGNWDADEIADVTSCIKRGLRNFYFPPRTDNTGLAHRWSFLRPQATLVIWDDLVTADAVTATISYSDPVSTVTASEAAFYPSMEGKTLVTESGNSYVIATYTSSTVVTVTGDASGDTGDIITIDSEDTFALPWDYGGMSGDGTFTYDNSESKINTISLVAEARIRHYRQTSISTGTPWMVAITPLTTDGAQGQRWQAMFHSPPNEVLTLHYRYYVLPDALVLTDLEYPYGSAAHSETILESCLAVAESREKDMALTEHQARFGGLLVSSIDNDRGLGEPIVHYGYNRDDSDGSMYSHGHDGYNGHHHHHDFVVTFNE